MYLVSATPTKLFLNFYETLHSCTQPADVHEGISGCCLLDITPYPFIFHTSAGSVQQMCKVSQNSNKPFRRSCTYKVHDPLFRESIS
jgi:hypothetical protein